MHIVQQAELTTSAPTELLADAYESAVLGARLPGVMGWLRGDVRWSRPSPQEVPDDGYQRPAPVYSRRAHIPFGRTSGTGCYVDLHLWPARDGVQGLLLAFSQGWGSTGHRKYFAAACRDLAAVPGTRLTLG